MGGFQEYDGLGKVVKWEVVTWYWLGLQDWGDLGSEQGHLEGYNGERDQNYLLSRIRVNRGSVWRPCMTGSDRTKAGSSKPRSRAFFSHVRA